MATVGRPVPRTLVVGAGALLAAAVLLGVALVNYLLFHTLVEMAAVGVGLALFILVWSTRPYIENAYFLVLGIGLLFVGGLTLLHALAYDGMGVFAGPAPGLATQFWIAGGLLAAATAVGAPLAIGREVPPRYLLGAYAAATAALLAAIATGAFPDVNAGGLGAPVFPLGAEVVIVAGIGAGMLLLYQRRAAFDEEMLHLLLGALGSYLAAEVCFALTVDALVPLSLAGHLLRLLAFYLFARAIVEFGVRRPYSVLFRELSSRTDELREAREYVEGLLEQAPGPILVLDAEGRIARLNRAFERLTGRSSAGLAGRVLADALPGIAPTVREAGTRHGASRGRSSIATAGSGPCSGRRPLSASPTGRSLRPWSRARTSRPGSRPSAASAPRSTSSRSRTRGSSATPTWRATTCRSRFARSSLTSSSSSAATGTGSTRTPTRSSATSSRAGSACSG